MKHQIAIIIQPFVKDFLSVEAIELLLEKPKHQHLGDIAFPCLIWFLSQGQM